MPEAKTSYAIFLEYTPNDCETPSYSGCGNFSDKLTWRLNFRQGVSTDGDSPSVETMLTPDSP